MGITGLLPFLEKSSQKTNISQFTGGTVAIDSYCWLHRGAFSCADKLSMGQTTDAYVTYCKKFIDMLLSHQIKPILIFDGRHLPAKAQTEIKRREARQTNHRKGIELMRMGQHAEGRNLLKRSIDITHEMALKLIKKCHEMNIDCIVAPYEADAQLAYLNINGIADVVITEDSDLMLFGCKKVFFKMDITGHGVLVDQDRLYLSMGLRAEHFSLDNFRYMCILSGCDYLASLPGIGLQKAKKFITTNTDCDIHKALTKLGSYLNMKALVVTKEYRDAFILADITFKHQLVFCPLQRKQVRLNIPVPDITEEQLSYAGVETNPDIALQLALGNCDPFTLERLHDFNPDKVKHQNNKHNSQHSIWSKKYRLKQCQVKNQQDSPEKMMTWPNTAGKEMVLQTKRLRNTIPPILEKQEDDSECNGLNQKEILNMYECNNVVNEDSNSKLDISMPSKEEVSPVLLRRTNPFSQRTSSHKTSPSLLSKSRSRIMGRNTRRARRTIIDEGTVTESKFFVKSADGQTSKFLTDENMSCSFDNSNEVLLEKENIELDKTHKTTNNNFQKSVVTEEMKMEFHPMDVDEEMHNTSFADIECSNSPSYCDVEKSHLDVQIRESNSRRSSRNKSYSLNTSLTSSKVDVDSDFLIQHEDISISNSNVFKWSNTKLSEQISKKTKYSKDKRFSNSRTISDTKINLTSTTRQSKLGSTERQQNLLSMYGFQKKKLL